MYLFTYLLTPRLLGVYYFLSLTLSVCMYVCMSVTLLQIDSSLFLDGIEPFLGHQFSITKTKKRCSSNFDLLPWQRNLGYFCKNFKLLVFCFSMESSHFWAVSSPWNPLQKRCSSIFDLGPLTPKTDSTKFEQKSPITRLVWQIDHRCLRLIGGFRGWPIEWNHTKCCAVDPCCHGNEIWAKIAYNSTCTADRPQMFRPSRGFSGMADSMQPCKILYGRPLLPWPRHLR